MNEFFHNFIITMIKLRIRSNSNMANRVCRTIIIICYLSYCLTSSSIQANTNINNQSSLNPYAVTSTSDIETSNPIKLTVVQNAPSFDLPQITGPLSLAQAVNIALKNNLSLRLSKQTWQASSFLVRAALAKFGPASSFNTWYANSSLSQMLFYPNNTQVNPTTMQPIVKGSSLALLFVATQPIFTGGLLMGGYRMAQAKEKQLREGFHEDRLTTALKVKEAYYNAAFNQAKLKVDSDYVKFRQISTSNMKERYLDGKTPKADYLREEAELAKARQQINDDYRDFNTNLLNLKVAMGLNIGSPISLNDCLSENEGNGDVSTYLIEAQKSRPELKQADALIDEMKGNKLVKRSSYLPQIGLYGGSSNITGNSPDGNAQGKWGGFIGVMAGITLFDSGLRLNELRAANVELRKAKIIKQDAELKVAQQVAQAWIDLDLAKRNIDLAKSQVISAKEDQRLFHERFLIGKSIALEDFEATVKLFRAKLAVIESIYKYKLAEANLKRASGQI